MNCLIYLGREGGGERLVPELQGYYRQFAAIEREAEVLLEGLTEAQLTWRDNSTMWSIADCLNHLIVTGNQSLQGIRSAVLKHVPAACLPKVPFGTACLAHGSFV